MFTPPYPAPLNPVPPMSYSVPSAPVSTKVPAPAIYSEPHNDGISVTKAGKVIVGKNSPYELFALSIVEVDGKITFHIESNLPLSGLPEPRAKAKRIGYGDLLLYYQNSTVGIKFTGKNQGIYHDVKTVNNARLHFGNKTPQEYVKRLKSAKAYSLNMDFPPEWVTHIKKGSLISQNFKVTQVKKGDRYLIEITTQRNLLPAGNFIAYLPTECINDYVSGVYPLSGSVVEEIDEGGKDADLIARGVVPNTSEFGASNILSPVAVLPAAVAIPGAAIVSPFAIAGGAGLLVTGAFLALNSSSDSNSSVSNSSNSSSNSNSRGSDNDDSDEDSTEVVVSPTTPSTPTPDTPNNITPSPTPTPNPPEAIPEPSTILGALLSVGIGAIFKQKRNQATQKNKNKQRK